MIPIEIGSIVPAEKLHNTIEKFSLNEKVDISYEDYNNRYIYSFMVDRENVNYNIDLYKVLAKFIQEIILKHYSKKFIKERLDHYNKYIGLRNKEIVDTVYNRLIDKNRLIKEKEYMEKEILDYIIENKTIIIDGYLIFRSKSFTSLIDRTLENVMEEIHLDMEYNEFIYTLQRYIENQEAQINGVNVFMKKEDFEIKGFDNIPINNDFIVFTLEKLFDNNINQGDILLNTLLALLPGKINIHVKSGREEKLLNILKRIFKDRLNICHGCRICRQKINNNKRNKS